jgi:hypothetical protein
MLSGLADDTGVDWVNYHTKDGSDVDFFTGNSV